DTVAVRIRMELILSRGTMEALQTCRQARQFKCRYCRVSEQSSAVGNSTRDGPLQEMQQAGLASIRRNAGSFSRPCGGPGRMASVQTDAGDCSCDAQGAVRSLGNLSLRAAQLSPLHFEQV